MKEKFKTNRRSFIKTSAASLAGAGLLYSSSTIEGKGNGKAQTNRIKEYRLLGRTGFKVSDIGVGKPFNPAVLEALLDAGVNYIDTAESYGLGKSEKVIAEVIKNRDRKSLFITSKLMIRGNSTKEKILSRARKCLERLRVDYLDCMMIHGCSTVKMVNYRPFHEAMKQLKNEGKLRFTGMSNHGGNYNDVPESMERVHLAAIQSGKFDVLLMVYNFLKREMGEKILSYCKEKNIGTVLMKVNPVGSYHAYKERLEEAVKEGRSTKRLKAIVERLKKRVDLCQDFIKKNGLTNNEAIRSAAYRFVLNNRNAHTALFNFSNFDQVEKVIGLSGKRLSTSDRQILALVEQGCADLYCRHACGLCQYRCPKGVPVNTIMRYNYYFEVLNQEKNAMQKYAALPGFRADQCYACSGFCQSACPHDVPIQGLLVMAHQNLTLRS